MLTKKTIIAAAVFAAFTVPAAFAASSDANFGQVMTSIQASKMGATQIQGLTDVKTVNVVKVGELSDISQGTNQTDFDNAVTKHDADITSLRTAITTNAKVNSALQQQNVDINSVVATNVETDGSLTVYVRSSDANFGQVMTSIQASKMGATQIQGLTDVKTVNVVKVGQLPDISQGTNQTDFDNAVTKNDADITSLRTAITTNAKVNSALQQKNVDINSVVATDVGTDGTLTVYVR